MSEEVKLADVALRLAERFENATGHLTPDYGEVSGQGFQMMTMDTDPVGFAADLNRLPEIAAALATPQPAEARGMVEARQALQMAGCQLASLGTPDDEVNNAVLAIIDAALSATDAEAVAWLYRIASNLGTPYVCIERIEETPGWTEAPLYAHPPADKARIAELEAALAPFALHIRDGVPDEQMIEGVGWAAADHRRARAALENRPTDQGGEHGQG